MSWRQGAIIVPRERRAPAESIGDQSEQRARGRSRMGDTSGRKKGEEGSALELRLNDGKEKRAVDLETFVRKTLEAVHKGVKEAEGVFVYDTKESVEFDLLLIDTTDGLSVASNSHQEARASRVKFKVEVKMPQGKVGPPKAHPMVG